MGLDWQKKESGCKWNFNGKLELMIQIPACPPPGDHLAPLCPVPSAETHHTPAQNSLQLSTSPIHLHPLDFIYESFPLPSLLINC